MKDRVAVIGVGKLGGLIIQRMIKLGTYKPENIRISRADNNKLGELKERFPRCVICSTVVEAISSAQLIVLAVRPSDVEAVADQIRANLGADQMILSVVTARSLATISKLLETKQVMRVNTNVLLAKGKAVSIWQSFIGVVPENRELCSRLILTWGEIFQVLKEDHLDLATIATGCMPALQMYVLNALTQILEEMGFPKKLCERVVTAVCKKALQSVAPGKLKPAEMIASVATGKGATAAILTCFEQHEVAQGIKKGLVAGRDRIWQMR